MATPSDLVEGISLVAVVLALGTMAAALFVLGLLAWAVIRAPGGVDEAGCGLLDLYDQLD